MVLPSISLPQWAARLRAANRSRIVVLLLCASVLVVLSTAYLLLIYRREPNRPYPHTPHPTHPTYRPPQYPSKEHKWLDTTRLTQQVNITRMLEAEPGRWDMFLDPIPELLHALPPETHGCEDTADFGPLVFIGVFSVAGEHRQRAVIRALQTLHAPPSEKVVMKFILGKNKDPELQRKAEWEGEIYGDVVFLDVQENMNEGKTYAYFRWVSEMREGERPRFTLKADSDTFLTLPLVLHTLSQLPCSTPAYWGTSWGSCLSTCTPFYMRGLAYGLSWPLVAWLGSADLPEWAVRGMEDARTGSWFANLPRGGEKLTVVDLHTHMGDWDGTTIPLDGETVALHAMKSSEHYAEVAGSIRDIWKKKGWEWRWPPEGTWWDGSAPLD